MTFTYSDTDLSTDLAKVRRIISDVDSNEPIFTDEEIAGFLTLETGVRRAAAMALETMASRDAYVLKVMRRGDLQTDGAKTAEALMKRAATLRDQADDAELDDDAGFEIAEWVLDDFSARERIEKQALRGVL